MRFRTGSVDYARDCQFIAGYDQKGLAVFCTQPSKPGSSYCVEHYPRIYQRAPGFDARRLAESMIETAAARPEPDELATATAAAEEELEAASVE